MFRSGMPKEAAGPVAETTTPTFSTSWAEAARPSTNAIANQRFMLYLLFPPGWTRIGSN
ncbi:hypothetical protein FJNA_07090 [Thermus sp. FJN-A]